MQPCLISVVTGMLPTFRLIMFTPSLFFHADQLLGVDITFTPRLYVYAVQPVGVNESTPTYHPS